MASLVQHVAGLACPPLSGATRRPGALARLLPAGSSPGGGPLPLPFLAFLSPAIWPQSFAPAPLLSKLLPRLAATPHSPALSSALSGALLATLVVADPASAPLGRAFIAARPPPLIPADAAPVAQRLLLEFAGTGEAPRVMLAAG